MNTTVSLVEGVIVMLAVILLAILLKKVRILKKEQSLLFSKLVLKLTLPALILSSLAKTQFNPAFLRMSLTMAIIEVGMIILAWLVGTLLKLSKAEKGGLMLVSAFGMSTMLGYPLIRQVFPGNALAMEEAVITGEIGVGFLLFIFGPLIAMYFGESKVKGRDLGKSALSFFISPIFISIVAGIGLSFLELNEKSTLFTLTDRILTILADANFLLVALAIGLIIEVKNLRNYYLFILIAILIKLILKPSTAFLMVSNPEFTDMMREIILIETAMPSAVLAAVFARTYNCKPELVSTTVVTTLLISTITVSAMFVVLF